MRRVNLGHYVVGIEGLAVFRSYLTGDRAQVERRIDDLTRLVTDRHSPPMSFELDVPEMDVQAGYGAWAGTYDSQPNPLINLEQPVVRALIDGRPPGDALDAACGTGRHTTYLQARGHRVVGVDTSAAMLQAARVAFPGIDFQTGDLRTLPIDSATMDLAVCALALTHCETLGPPIAELARVLRPAGRLVLSDFHPVMTALGGTAFFVGVNGAGYVRSYFHTHAEYLAAFKAAGLTVEQCIEPCFTDQEIPLMMAGLTDAGEAFRAALLGIPGALIWELIRE